MVQNGGPRAALAHGFRITRSIPASPPTLAIFITRTHCLFPAVSPRVLAWIFVNIEEEKGTKFLREVH